MVLRRFPASQLPDWPLNQVHFRRRLRMKKHFMQKQVLRFMRLMNFFLLTPSIIREHSGFLFLSAALYLEAL